jgi:hypothetical protein
VLNGGWAKPRSGNREQRTLRDPGIGLVWNNPAGGVINSSDNGSGVQASAKTTNNNNEAKQSHDFSFL